MQCETPCPGTVTLTFLDSNIAKHFSKKVMYKIAIYK